MTSWIRAAGLAAAIVLLTAGAASAAPRVIILGFDGVDDAVTQRLLEEGHLPNLARLKEMGSYRPLETTNPAQSPVSWASFATGTNPGKTGIYDFLKRIPGTYDPQLGLARKVMSPEFTPQAGTRWLMRVGAGLLLVALAWLAVRVILRRRTILWLPIGLALGFGAGYGLEHFFLQHVPETLPTAVNLRQGRTFWQTLGEKGVPCVVVEAPTSFPADVTENGKVLAGLGVPDVLGTFGLYFVFTNDPTVKDQTEMGAIVRRGSPDADGVVRSWVRGPENFLLAEEKKADLRRRIRNLEDRLDITSGDDAVRKRLGELERELYPSVPVEIALQPGADPKATVRVQGQEQTVKVGEWSEFFTFEFAFNKLLKPSGIARFLVNECGEKTYTVLLSMINWNPKNVPPNVPLTHPHEWAGELGQSLGFFDTLGWACVTSGLKDEMLSEEAFLAHTNLLWDNRERKTMHLLEQGGWECFISVLTETDRVQHMMWRLVDEKSPRYDAALAARFGDSIQKIYQRMDRLVGRVMDEYLDDDTILMVCSDHGFQPFRRSVNLNTWLVRNGFMGLRGQGQDLTLDDLFDPDAELFSNVDWSKTKAYSMGLGKIYINLKGREPEGIVAPEDYDRVGQEIIDGLLALRDEDGTKVVRSVYRRDDIYVGAQLENAEDLILGFEPGYRVGWQTTLGGAPPDILEDNKQKWSGDHCSFDPSLVKGILFCSRPIEVDDPSVQDIGPTVLSLMGKKPDPAMDGRVILGKP